MGLNWGRTLLLWDPDDTALDDLRSAVSEARGVRVVTTPYHRIGSDPALDREIQASRAEAIIFTRNEDMPGAPAIGKFLGQARMGYTAVSAIDVDDRIHQTRQCLEDLIKGHGDVPVTTPLPARPLDRGNGTFSLIFDFEQFGGARFGLPRLLPLVESRGIRCTFFVTGFITEVYPGLIERLVNGGHEIGAHGWMHEFLSGRPLEEQMASVASQANALRRYGDIAGANFIYRMDAMSPQAILHAGLRYLVLFRKHVFYRSRFMSPSTKPRLLRTGAGDVTIIPVPVETYNVDRPMLQIMIENAWKRSCIDRVHHINVLMHPFKDGAQSRLPVTEWLLDFLLNHLGLTPVPLREVPQPIVTSERSILIAYRWDGYEPPLPPAMDHDTLALSWWAPVVYHAQRTEDLADALVRSGRPGVLCAETSEAGMVRVYPDGLDVPGETIMVDPLVRPNACAYRVQKSCEHVRNVQVAPGSKVRDLLFFVWSHIPRTRLEVVLTCRRIWRKMTDGNGHVS